MEHWNYSGLPPVERYNKIVDTCNDLLAALKAVWNNAGVMSPELAKQVHAAIAKVKPAVITTIHICGGKQAHVCHVTGKEHDMSAIVRFKDGGSVACKDCGVTAMQIDMLELP